MGLYDDALAVLASVGADPFVADVLRWKGTLLRERGETDAANKRKPSAFTLTLRSSPKRPATRGFSE